MAGYLLQSALLFALFFLSGVGLERLCSTPRRRFAEALLLRFALGLAVWMGVLFLLAASGALAPRPLFALGAALAASGLGAMRLRPAGSSHAGDPLPDRSRRRLQPLEALLLLALAVAALLLFRLTLSPDVAWDANAYHLTVPRLYLEHGGFLRIPYNVYSNWPLNVELLFALAMSLGGYVLAKLVHFGFGVLSAGAVYHLVSHENPPGGRLAGLWAVAFFLVNPVVLYEMRIAYVELALAFYLILAVLLLHRALSQRQGQRTHLLLCGICCGVLAGAKLNGVFGLACVLALLSWEWWRRGRRSPEPGPGLVPSLLLVAVPALLLALPWLGKSLILTGNPCYPFFYEWFGGSEWSPELAELHSAWQWSIGMGRDPVDYLLLPVRVILQGGEGYAHFDGRIHPLWIALVPCALIGARQDRLASRCLVVTLVYFLLWSVTSQQMRFLVPVLPLLAVASARSLAALLRGLPAPLWRRAAEAVLSLLVLGLLVHGLADLRRAGWRPHAVFAFINENLPADSRILFLNTNQGFFCRRPFIADSFFQASQMRALLADLETEAAVGARLRELGVTHILFDRRDRGIVYPRALGQFLRDGERVSLLYRSPDARFLVYSLRPEGSAVPRARS